MKCIFASIAVQIELNLANERNFLHNFEKASDLFLDKLLFTSLF